MKDCEHYLFYGNDIAGNTVRLDISESNHAVSVLRVKKDQRLQVTDGNGAVYDCRCMDITRQSVSCEIIGKSIIPRIAPELILLVGIPDREHFETVIEHATALGVSRIVPLVMDHCRKPWWESWEKQRRRFASKMVVSMKQCLYPYIPQLDAPTSLGSVIDTCEKPLIVADQCGKVLRDADLSLFRNNKIYCLVGPPGGISENESKILNFHETLTIKIAPTRLRTELAATILCSRVMGAF